MKKLISLLLIAFVLVGILTACGDKEDSSEKAAETVAETVSIIGTWKYELLDAAYTFNADGTGSYSFYGTDLPFTYTDDGSKVVIHYDNSDGDNVLSYTIEGNVLHITDSLGAIVDYTKQ